MASQLTQSSEFSLTASRFKFPDTYFYAKYCLPNSLHPWFNVFVVDINAAVYYRNSRKNIVYPDCLEELDGMLEWDREHIIANCKERYDDMVFQRSLGEFVAQHRGGYSSEWLNAHIERI